MIEYTKQSLAERLELLYGAEVAASTLPDVKKMIGYYRKLISAEPYHLTEKDSILITYGDQIQREGAPHLKTLAAFAKEYIGDAINTVHILPFYPYSSDDGFSVIDYKAVNPDLGTWTDVEEIAQDSRLMFDAVINHISQESDWFKGYLAGKPEYENFFIDVPPGTDVSMVVRPRALPLLSPFEDHEGNIKLVWTTFSRDQVDVNYENPKVLLAVLDVLLFYVSKGAKLIRMDAIAFVWKKLGTMCIHLEETHQVIQFLRDAIHHVAPEVVIITETNVPHKENISYFGSGDDEAQMVYNFALPPLLAHAIITGDTYHLVKWALSLTLPSDKVCFFNFTASHDGIGLRPVSEILSRQDVQALITQAEYSGGRVSMRSNGDGTESPYEINCNYMDLISPLGATDHQRAQRMILAQGLTLAMPGVPGIYFHSLVGSRNDIEGMELTKINRSINREKLNWFTLVKDLEEVGSQRELVYSMYLKLLQIRKQECAFNPFAPFEVFETHNDCFVMLRTCNKTTEKVLVVANFRDQNITIGDLPMTGYAKDLISENRVELNKISLGPYQLGWLKIE